MLEFDPDEMKELDPNEGEAEGKDRQDLSDQFAHGGAWDKL